MLTKAQSIEPNLELLEPEVNHFFYFQNKNEWRQIQVQVIIYCKISPSQAFNVGIEWSVKLFTVTSEPFSLSNHSTPGIRLVRSLTQEIDFLRFSSFEIYS